jgi:hypothetical protein
VIIETNKTTERIFPAVPDVEHPDFFKRMDRLVELNTKVCTCGAPCRARARLVCGVGGGRGQGQGRVPWR